MTHKNIITDQLKHEAKSNPPEKSNSAIKFENKLSKICDNFRCNCGNKYEHIDNGTNALKEMKQAQKGASIPDIILQNVHYHDKRVPLFDYKKRKLIINTSQNWHELNAK